MYTHFLFTAVESESPEGIINFLFTRVLVATMAVIELNNSEGQATCQ